MLENCSFKSNAYGVKSPFEEDIWNQLFKSSSVSCSNFCSSSFVWAEQTLSNCGINSSYQNFTGIIDPATWVSASSTITLCQESMKFSFTLFKFDFDFDNLSSSLNSSFRRNLFISFMAISEWSIEKWSSPSIPILKTISTIERNNWCSSSVSSNSFSSKFSASNIWESLSILSQFWILFFNDSYSAVTISQSFSASRITLFSMTPLSIYSWVMRPTKETKLVME